ncbi:ribosomal protein S5 domain 2-type protein [Entophlyctis helioformis]|nr:ribosomal protein S5 domain 2-type protein [Entophlyctis helioformis]
MSIDQAAQEELESLCAIYLGDGTDTDDAPMTINADSPGSLDFNLGFGCALEVHLASPGYPASQPPFYVLRLNSFRSPFPGRAGELTAGAVTTEDEFRGYVDAELVRLFVPGEPVVFSWVDWLKGVIEKWYGPVVGTTAAVAVAAAVAALPANNDSDDDDEYDDDEDAGRGAVDPAAIETDAGANDAGFVMPAGCPAIVSSQPLVERRSVFVAHVAAVTSVAQVQLVKQALLSNKRIARATHNIAAFRIVESNGVVRQDCDDDGETAAGGRLLHLLELSGCRNVYVVVSRWYGGVQLGPLRFKLINNCARQLLQERGFLHGK